MVRYPWHDPLEDEQEYRVAEWCPWKALDWQVKSMLRRAFGKDTLAKTVLQCGSREAVLQEYAWQSNREHLSQAIAYRSLEQESLAQVRRGLKSEGWSQGLTWEKNKQRKRNLADVSRSSGSQYEQRQLPRGIAGRVALRLMPDGPRWLGYTTCIANHDVRRHRRCNHDEVMLCYLCHAPVCARHCAAVGHAAVDANGGRLGAGHARCKDTDSCEKRIRIIAEALP